MQAEILDSTVSQLLQDNSSVEYVDARENPITTVQNRDLIFGQTHNGIECALCPTAKRACDRAWLSAKQVENWSKMPKRPCGDGSKNSKKLEEQRLYQI